MLCLSAFERWQYVVQVEGENIRFVPTPLLNKEICQDALSSVVRRWSMWINILWMRLYAMKRYVVQTAMCCRPGCCAISP